MRPLRPYQIAGINGVFASLRSGKRRPVLQIPTAGGKTRIAAEIISRGLAKYNGSFPCVFTVPRISLIDQTVEDFWEEGIKDIGVMQGDHPLRRPRAAIQVASLQTLENRRLPVAKLVIVDECHLRSKFLSAWMRKPEWTAVPFIGLSATPWTPGMGGENGDWDDLIVAATSPELIEAKHLSDYRMYGPGHPDLSGVKTRRDAETGEMDFAKGELAAVMSRPALVADAVASWLEKGEDRPTLCFAVDCAHARKLQEQFQSAGVPSEYMDAYTPRTERTKIGARLKSGETKVVTNVGVATTGVNWPWVSCIILARPCKSESLLVQMVGRVLRLHPQGGDSIILDHTDVIERFRQLPTEIHHDTLDDGTAAKSGKAKKAADKKPVPKVCPSCSVIKPAGVHKCPACGFAPAKQSDLDFAPGELIEVTRNPALAARSGPAPADLQRWYSMLVWQAIDKKYKPSWVDVNFRKRWGDWPERHGINRDCAPLAPDAPVRGWLKSQFIAWQKGKAKDRRRAA